MTNETTLLIKKLEGIRDTLGKYKPAELGKPPSPAFAEDYNRARDFALKEKPAIKDLAPPEVAIGPNHLGIRIVASTYLEILTYTSQLIGLLS